MNAVSVRLRFMRLETSRKEMESDLRFVVLLAPSENKYMQKGAQSECYQQLLFNQLLKAYYQLVESRNTKKNTQKT